MPSIRGSRCPAISLLRRAICCRSVNGDVGGTVGAAPAEADRPPGSAGIAAPWDPFGARPGGGLRQLAPGGPSPPRGGRRRGGGGGGGGVFRRGGGVLGGGG